MAARHLIIGIDPGATVGIAAVDLRGKTAATAHSLGGGMEDAIAIIEKWGTPSLIAVDVRPAPSLAVRIAASFSVPIFVPERPWREGDKQRLLRHLSVSVANAHERDALSAAVMAFRANQNTLGQRIEGPALAAEQLDLLRHLLLQGIRQSAALSMLQKKQEPPPEAKQQAPHPQKAQSMGQLSSMPPNSEKTISELRKRVHSLELENDALARKIRLLENGVRERIARDQMVQKLQCELARLKSSIEAAKRMRKLQKQPKQKRENEARTPSSGLPASLKALDGREGMLERIIREYRKGRPGN